MKNSGFPLYEGKKNSCCQCERNFKEGDVITVAEDEKTFCYSDAMGGCLIDYVFKVGKQMMGKSMRFKK